jgi:hypothetical protein
VFARGPSPWCWTLAVAGWLSLVAAGYVPLRTSGEQLAEKNRRLQAGLAEAQAQRGASQAAPMAGARGTSGGAGQDAFAGRAAVIARITTAAAEQGVAVRSISEQWQEGAGVRDASVPAGSVWEVEAAGTWSAVWRAMAELHDSRQGMVVERISVQGYSPQGDCGCPDFRSPSGNAGGGGTGCAAVGGTGPAALAGGERRVCAKVRISCPLRPPSPASAGQDGLNGGQSSSPSP